MKFTQSAVFAVLVLASAFVSAESTRSYTEASGAVVQVSDSGLVAVEEPANIEAVQTAAK